MAKRPSNTKVMVPRTGDSSARLSGSSQSLDVPFQPPARLARKWWGLPEDCGKVIVDLQRCWYWLTKKDERGKMCYGKGTSESREKSDGCILYSACFSRMAYTTIRFLP